jgi:hypothetical protein
VQPVTFHPKRPRQLFSQTEKPQQGALYYCPARNQDQKYIWDLDWEYAQGDLALRAYALFQIEDRDVNSKSRWSDSS